MDAGTGFHQQLMADESLNLGFSATAMHYVSEKPCELTSHVHMVGASTEEQEKFRLQAAQDLDRILLARAAELIPVDGLSVLILALMKTAISSAILAACICSTNLIAFGNLCASKVAFTEEEYIQATFTQHYRTMDEFFITIQRP